MAKPNTIRTPAKAVPRRGVMNKLETDYSQLLDIRMLGGEIQEWAFEPERFRLAGGAYYTPDFRVVLANGEVELHEIKGHWREAARVRIKVASELHPYRFIAVTRTREGEWQYEVLK